MDSLAERSGNEAYRNVSMEAKPEVVRHAAVLVEVDYLRNGQTLCHVRLPENGKGADVIQAIVAMYTWCAKYGGTTVSKVVEGFLETVKNAEKAGTQVTIIKSNEMKGE